MRNLFERYGVVWAPEGVGGGAAAAGSPSSAPSAAPSGASPTPSSSPSSSAPSSPAPSTTSPGPAGGDGAGESFDFNSIFEGGVSDAGAALAAPEVPPAQTTGAAPLGPPQEPPPAAAPAEGLPATEAPAAPVAPAAAQGAPDQSTPPGQPSAGQYIDQYDPAALAQHLSQNEAQALDLVANQMFQLAPEEKEALEQDVIGTIPKLLAKVFVKSQQNVLLQMGRMLPVMMQRHLEANKRNTSNEDKFYARWGDIKRDKHHDSVMKYAAVYRQMHPQASMDQMIEDLGPMIMMAHKIVPSVGNPSAAPGRSPATAAPSAANGRSPPPTPFVPAGTGPATVARAPDVEAWEAMFREPPT